jgi:hypothetical protein
VSANNDCLTECANNRVVFAIVGSRDFPYLWMIGEYLLRKKFDEIVSGGAKGVDTYAAKYARAQGVPCKVFPADWDGLGKGAGFIRNRQIVEYATDVIAFHYGDSKGTAHTIDLARKAGKLREVIHVY